MGGASLETESIDICPVCGSTERALLHGDLVDGVFGAPGRWNLYRCGACGSAYLNPRPTQETIHIAYQRYFTHSESPGGPRDEKLSRARRLRRALGNGYRNWRYGCTREPAARLGVPLAWVLRGSRRTVDQEFRHIPRSHRGGTLLDCGAGNGGFLAKAREAGWSVVGVEPDPNAIKAARCLGLNVRQGGLEQCAGEEGTFDVITMSHVIEHVHDPRNYLKQAFSLLKPGGSLYIDTPNINARGHKKFGPHWRGLEPPRHLVIFNWRSLETTLHAVGFARARRLARTDVYPNLARISRLLQEGQDPEVVKNQPSRGDLLFNWALRGKALFSCEDSEFITLMAYKPAQ